MYELNKKQKLARGAARAGLIVSRVSGLTLFVLIILALLPLIEVIIGIFIYVILVIFTLGLALYASPEDIIKFVPTSYTALNAAALVLAIVTFAALVLLQADKSWFRARMAFNSCVVRSFIALAVLLLAFFAS